MSIQANQTVQSAARAGLQASSGTLFKGSAIRKAEQALADVVTLAAAGRGEAAAARVGRVTADALADVPGARLAVLRQTLTSVEAGVASGVGCMSQFAYQLLEAMDGAKAGAARPAAVRATLDAIAATSAGEPQGDYAAYIARLGHEVSNPVYTLNMLDRVNCAEVKDVTQPHWYAAVGYSFATGALFEPASADLGRVLGVVDVAVRERAETLRDDLTRGHLEREQAWAEALDLSPNARTALHLATLRVAGDEVACAPETAVVLACQARNLNLRMPAEEKARIVDHAFAEMRTANLPPDSPACRWLRFHDDAPGLGLSEAYVGRLQETAFTALVEGRPAAAGTLHFSLAYGLEPMAPERAHRLFDLVADLSALPQTDLEVARFGLDLHKGASEPQPAVAAAFAERAWQRISALPSPRADRNALVEMTRLGLEKASDADRPAMIVDALERLCRLDTDSVQQALVRAAAPPVTTGTVRQEEDYVLIGSVKVPRKAVQR